MSENSFLGTQWHEKIFTGTWTNGADESYDVIEPATGRPWAAWALRTPKM